MAMRRKYKFKIHIPDQGLCTDLEYVDYIHAYRKQCKCGKKD